MKLDGIAAIVTGGGSGLGAETARALAAGGAKVAVFDLDAAAGAEVAAEIGGWSAGVDVADEASVAAALAGAERAHGVARILVNCAGVVHLERTVSREGAPHGLASFRRSVDVNMTGTFNVAAQMAARASAAELVGEERGVIVNTASIAAFDGQIGRVAYAASKAGVVGMTLPMARDLARHAIRVMAIAPGLFHTPLIDSQPAAAEALAKDVPFPQRLGTPGEFAALVLAIIANPMLNGEVIRLDAALRMAVK